MKIAYKNNLQKALEDECQNGDLASRIAYNSQNSRGQTRNGRDNAIQNKPNKLQIQEEWQKTTPKSEDELESMCNTWRSMCSGNNTYIFSLVRYDEKFPNRRISIPEISSKPYNIQEKEHHEQTQLILDSNAIILRQFQGGQYDIEDYAMTAISFGSMLGTNNSKANERLIKVFFEDFAKNPANYISYTNASTYEFEQDDKIINNIFRVFILYEREQGLLEKIINPMLNEQGYKKLS